MLSIGRAHVYKSYKLSSICSVFLCPTHICEQMNERTAEKKEETKTRKTREKKFVTKKAKDLLKGLDPKESENKWSVLLLEAIVL